MAVTGKICSMEIIPQLIRNSPRSVKTWKQSTVNECKRLATPLIQGLGTFIYCESQNYYFLSEHENVQFKSIKEELFIVSLIFSANKRDKGISTNSLCFCFVVVLVVVLVCVREHRGICVCRGQRSRRNFLFFLFFVREEGGGGGHTSVLMARVLV